MFPELFCDLRECLVFGGVFEVGFSFVLGVVRNISQNMFLGWLFDLRVCLLGCGSQDGFFVMFGIPRNGSLLMFPEFFSFV